VKDSDQVGRLYPEEEVEIRTALAELKGGLDKTPKRLDFYMSVLTIAGIFAAALIALNVLYIQKLQSDFEKSVNDILDERNAEQVENYLKLKEELLFGAEDKLEIQSE